MASIIAKNSDGKIWKNSDGKILKAKTFSEDVIQNGLAFWGVANPSYLTTIDGLISEAYDIRETNFVTPIYGKMIQNTVSSRPTLYNSSIRFNRVNTFQFLQKSNVSAKSIFLVQKIISAAPNQGWGGIGLNFSTFLGDKYLGHAFYINSNNLNAYRNNVRYTPLSNLSANDNTLYILSTLSDFNLNDVTLQVGNIHAINYSYLPIWEVLEWGWYNRLLSEMEVIYNQNALMKKYGLI